MMLKPTCRIVMTEGFRRTGLVSRAVAALKGPDNVKVGFPYGKVDGKIIERAIFNEFGTRGSGKGFKRAGKGGKVLGGFGGPVPERPFMRNAMRANRAKYAALMSASAKSILLGIVTGKAMMRKREALEKLGALAQGDIQAEITALRAPPNAPLTIALKGSSNPLIDTGEMRQRVTWKVED